MIFGVGVVFCGMLCLCVLFLWLCFFFCASLFVSGLSVCFVVCFCGVCVLCAFAVVQQCVIFVCVLFLV